MLIELSLIFVLLIVWQQHRFNHKTFKYASKYNRKQRKSKLTRDVSELTNRMRWLEQEVDVNTKRVRGITGNVNSLRDEIRLEVTSND